MNFASIDISQFGTIISAIAALGTAAFGLVDATKAFKGGISNVGCGFIYDALRPYISALQTVSQTDPYAICKANWLNGMDKAEQKASARNLIRLGFKSETAADMADSVLPDSRELLVGIAQKIDSGETPTEPELTVLARFDAIIDARLDAAFERADQKYRNVSRVAAAGIAIVLAEIGAVSFNGTTDYQTLLLGLFVGIVAVPVAPLAKDLTSALSTATAAFKAIKR